MVRNMRSEQVHESTWMSHFACFFCRKSYKQSIMYRYQLRSETNRSRVWRRMDRERVCPDCRGALRDMGTSFSAPRQQDSRSWEEVWERWNGQQQAYVRYQYPGLRLLERLPRRRPGAKG